MPPPTTPDPHQPAPADATARREREAVEALRAAARAFAARSRAAQGLPPRIQDPEVIAKLVVLFRPVASDGDQTSTRRRAGLGLTASTTNRSGGGCAVGLPIPLPAGLPTGLPAT